MSPNPAVDPNGTVSAEQHVHVIAPEIASDLAQDAAAAWGDILASHAGHAGASLRALITAVLVRHCFLPSQILDRLTRQPVSSRGAAAE